MNQLSFVQPVDRLRQRVVIGVLYGCLSVIKSFWHCVVKKSAAALYPALVASGLVAQACLLAPMSFADKRLIS
jgi:hypothetical protein